jgi:hypothetical protein
MSNSLKIWLLCSLIISFSVAAPAHGVFPSVKELERSLVLVRGGQLPRDVMSPDGSIFHTYYVEGRDLGEGQYAVIIKLGR